MRGKTDLSSTEYDGFLSSKARDSRTARQELKQRHEDRRNANDGIRGWHFGISNEPVKVESKEHFKHELDKRGLMLRDDVKKELRGPRPSEFKKRGTGK